MGHNSVVSGHLKSIGISRVDWLLMGTPSFRASQNLVPNLNEIMEEYDEREEETIQDTQVETRRSEERVEVNREPEYSVEESRKRKRGDEGARAERSGEKVSDWVSDMAYIVWRDKLQHRDFIGKRGFNK